MQEYQQELGQLKDEFERYKTRAQSVLRSKGGGKVRTSDTVPTVLNYMYKWTNLSYSQGLILLVNT